jgi:hypothetical protein
MRYGQGQVEDVDERLVFVDRVVQLADLAGAAGVGGADELPDTIVGIVAHQQDGLSEFEDLQRLDALGA